MSGSANISHKQFGAWSKKTDPGGQVVGYEHPDMEHGIEKAPYGDAGPKWRFRGEGSSTLRGAKARAEAHHAQQSQS